MNSSKLNVFLSPYDQRQFFFYTHIMASGTNIMAINNFNHQYLPEYRLSKMSHVSLQKLHKEMSMMQQPFDSSNPLEWVDLFYVGLEIDARKKLKDRIEKAFKERPESPYLSTVAARTERNSVLGAPLLPTAIIDAYEETITPITTYELHSMWNTGDD